MAKAAIQRSISDLQKGSEDLFRNARLLHPDLPVARLIPHMIELAEPEFLAELDDLLRTQHFQKTARTVRADERHAEAADDLLFPEIREHAAKLPKRVPIGDGEFVDRPELTYEDLKRYLTVLNEQDRKRHEKRIAAVTALMELWPARLKKTQGVTLAEVDQQKAKKAGLI